MSESKFIKKENDIAEYEMEDKVVGEGKEYKAEKIEKRSENK